MPFVLDASITIAWAFDDEYQPGAAAVLERTQDDAALAPALWWFEVRNALIANERRGRQTEQRTASFLRELARLPVSIDRSPDEGAVLGLARRHRLTVYDSGYLELAQRTGTPLATLDGALIAAATAERVPLIGTELA
jgi:predicted nucleic acid-binding protein